ncbi:adenylate/guanylate cyclase domain-containing protein [Afifella sp. IM 167]|uniref:adenylate/guanylate cyclase domain-containing protein n=1 Tax=Afifella sp. IM 167 TaxID=2033586 RepID=UPI001CCFE7D4|nr:adenylate/guanylate cyclase domain-containing protein [Afifella sp. IM 167]MBZ8133988.1 hypothetical protein [Afifella sp. IM 167]
MRFQRLLEESLSAGRRAGPAGSPALAHGARRAARLAAAIEAEEHAGRRLAVYGRTVSVVGIGLLLFLIVPFPGILYYEGLLAVFLLLGLARLWLDAGKLYRWWTGYLLTAVDFALLTFTLLYPNPLFPFDHPPQHALRTGNFVYLYVMLGGLAFAFQPKHVLIGGIIGAAMWLAGVAILVMLPDTVLLPRGVGGIEALQLAARQPTLIDLSAVAQNIGVFLIVSLLLAMVVARSRALVRRQASLERERSNLARYFPPATVDRLAREDAALAQIREQNGAVLFADLVGFTTWSERHRPAEVIAYLRNVHAKLEEAVFLHGGTVDKFIGDGMMATFGTPDPGEHDALDALACLSAILEHFSRWNARRLQRGAEPVQISIGLHYGKVVVGNIGTERRLEFAVLGDTVNVASRLEGITRELACRAAISRAAAEAALAEAPEEAEALLARFEPRGPQRLYGRSELVEVLSAD